MLPGILSADGHYQESFLLGPFPSVLTAVLNALGICVVVDAADVSSLSTVLGRAALRCAACVNVEWCGVNVAPSGTERPGVEGALRGTVRLGDNEHLSILWASSCLVEGNMCSGIQYCINSTSVKILLLIFLAIAGRNSTI